MKAKYTGTCRECGQQFDAGTTVVYVGRGDMHHVACPSLTHKKVPWGLSLGELDAWYAAEKARMDAGREAAERYRRYREQICE